jgi:hypothetical protein
MEHITPHFIDREQREHIEFYQTWTRDVLRGALAGVDDLVMLRTRFTLDEDERRTAYDLGLDTDMIEDFREEIDSKIKGRVAEIAEDILCSVFHAKLFAIGIQAEDTVLPVESLEIQGERILPVVGGEPYDGPIDDVIFDR